MRALHVWGAGQGPEQCVGLHRRALVPAKASLPHSNTPRELAEQPRRRALVSRERLAEAHAGDRAAGLGEEQLQQLHIYFVDCECTSLTVIVLH